MNRKKNRIVAAIMALIGGSLGIHKFYLGHIGQGILYLLMTFIISAGFKFPITMFLGIIDGIKLLSMSDSEFDEKYNKLSGQRNRNIRGSSVNVNRRGDRIRNENRKSSAELTRMENSRKRYNYNKAKTADPFIKSGEKKYKEFDLEGAEKDFIQALELNTNNSNLLFKLAGVYSLLEEKDKAYFYIEESINMGYKPQEELKTKGDFAFLRIQPDYEAFVQRGYKAETTKGIAAPKSDLLSGGNDALLSQLNKLKDLRERGLLSDKEYLYEKEKLSRK